MRRTNKKGFTIVELVIVIAVIAILAAVLIPTFASLVNKANVSADEQAVRNMNIALAAADAGDEVKYLTDALAILRESGLDGSNYKALADGYKFVWDRNLNRVLYIDSENKVVYPSEYKDTLYDSNAWVGLDNERAWDTSWYVNSDSNKITEYTIDGQTYSIADGRKYEIKNADQLASLAQTIRADENKGANWVIVLDKDAEYDMGDVEWVAIPEFAGIFDGNGATIKNLTMKDTTLECKTAFSSASGKNVYLPYGFISVFTGAYFGNVTLDVKIENPGVDSLTSSNHVVAGAIGAVCASSKDSCILIDKVTVKGTVTGPHRVAGVVGYVGGTKDDNGDVTMAGTVKIQNCTNEAAVTSTTYFDSYETAGGILATANKFDEGKLEITGCTNKGNVSGSIAAGIMGTSFAGQRADNPADSNDKGHEYGTPGVVLIHNNTNMGNITAKHVCSYSCTSNQQPCAFAADIVAQFTKQSRLYVYENTVDSTSSHTVKAEDVNNHQGLSDLYGKKEGDSAFASKYTSSAPSN